MAQRSAAADLGIENVVSMPKSVFDNKDWDEYEKVVDDYIAKKKLKPEDTFMVDHPDVGPTYYKYNGPNSGGRKDWQEIKPANPDLISQSVRDLGLA